MSGSLNLTPSGERLHISIFGRRNSGKSSLFNAILGQDMAIVSDVPGTTTDPVWKAMELLPLGPVLITDTAGIDDVGSLGSQRVERTENALKKTDLVLLVIDAELRDFAVEEAFLSKVKSLNLPFLVVINKVDSINNISKVEKWCESLKLNFFKVSAKKNINIDKLKSGVIEILKTTEKELVILGDLINANDVVVFVVPIDNAAPKGRLILPQVLALRDTLDHSGIGIVTKETELAKTLEGLSVKPKIVVTDSQAFHVVDQIVPKDISLTSFSILMARYKGDLSEFVKGANAVGGLKPGDKILISEGCSHHKQEDDIGTVKIPKLLQKKIGADLKFDFTSGVQFPKDPSEYKLIIHCGGCTLNKREMLNRQLMAKDNNIPMTNYGVVLAYIFDTLPRALELFPEAKAQLTL